MIAQQHTASTREQPHATASASVHAAALRVSNVAAGALATLVASVATHPIKRYRSRLQMSDDATAASGGELSWRAACARLPLPWQALVVNHLRR